MGEKKERRQDIENRLVDAKVHSKLLQNDLNVVIGRLTYVQAAVDALIKRSGDADNIRKEIQQVVAREEAMRETLRD